MLEPIISSLLSVYELFLSFRQFLPNGLSILLFCRFSQRFSISLPVNLLLILSLIVSKKENGEVIGD